jgi:hypothetical protein
LSGSTVTQIHNKGLRRISGDRLEGGGGFGAIDAVELNRIPQS